MRQGFISSSEEKTRLRCPLVKLTKLSMQKGSIQDYLMYIVNCCLHVHYAKELRLVYGHLPSNVRTLC
jgi:hypothetical protein